jgi:hypothetical protein
MMHCLGVEERCEAGGTLPRRVKQCEERCAAECAVMVPERHIASASLE